MRMQTDTSLLVIALLVTLLAVVLTVCDAGEIDGVEIVSNEVVK